MFSTWTKHVHFPPRPDAGSDFECAFDYEASRDDAETTQEDRGQKFSLSLSVIQPHCVKSREKFQELLARISLIAAAFVFDLYALFEATYEIPDIGENRFLEAERVKSTSASTRSRRQLAVTPLVSQVRLGWVGFRLFQQ